jgi:phosphate transport system substrate-binding protein
LKYKDVCGLEVSYSPNGSSAGIQAIIDGTANFGASDALLTEEQLKSAEKSAGKLLTIPMTAGAVAVIYNLEGTGGGDLNLTGTVLADIYLEKITRWNDAAIAALNPGMNLPDALIAVVHRADSSGTSNIFTNYLDKISPEWHDKVGTGNSPAWPVGIGGEKNAGVASYVEMISNSIGYVELAYAIESGLPYAKLQNADGFFIKPTVESASAATGSGVLPSDMRVMITNAAGAEAYPIVGFTWILVHADQKDAEKGKALADFLWWALHDGQLDCDDLHYAKLSSDALAKAELLVGSMNHNGVPFITA